MPPLPGWRSAMLMLNFVADALLAVEREKALSNLYGRFEKWMH